MAGRIVILNGAPRSGKSSIARALQASVDHAWINFGVDVVMAMTPKRLQPGIGLRPGGERPDLEPFVRQCYAAAFDSISAHSRLGLDVVGDFGIHEGHSRPLGVWEDMQRRFAGLPLLTVGVLCDLETIMARRNADPQAQGQSYAAGEGVPAPVRRWQEAVHAGKTYDLTVDTGRMAPEDCAAVIAARLAGS